MARFLDFRSDTVTRPSPAMRKAMAEAEVGDDVFGEAPTVAKLQQRAADLFGMEAALFVPSGTMGNQIATWIHTGRGGQVVCEENCHIALYEGGAAAMLSGATVRTVRGRNGVFTPSQVRAHVYPNDPHFAPTKMVSIENTHNWSGGRIWPLDAYAAVRDHAHAAGAKFHIDGARILNAAVGAKPAHLAAGADSLMVCLSKGLGAPVGSLLLGSHAFIDEAKHVRKALGGGMRQVGILAAAGLVALDHAPKLADDHALATYLAKKLRKLPGLDVDMDSVETNMIMVDVSETGMSGPDFCDVANELGVGCLPRDNGPTARFVTHRDVTREDADEAILRLARLLES